MEKGTSTRYVDSLIRLKRAGITVWAYGDSGFFVRALTLRKGESSAYIDSLIALEKAGVDVDDSIVEALTLAKGENPTYMRRLLDLQVAEGVSEYEIEELTLEKATR